MRSLLLLRHALTENTRPGSRDHDRRLMPDGERQAAGVGEALHELGWAPELVLCSSAVRAVQTSQGLRLSAPVDVTGRLYNAGGEEIVDLIREVADDVSCLLVVGHAPGLPWVAHELADAEDSDSEALAAIEYRFPPGTLARLRIDGSWAELDRGSLVAVRFP